MGQGAGQRLAKSVVTRTIINSEPDRTGTTPVCLGLVWILEITKLIKDSELLDEIDKVEDKLREALLARQFKFQNADPHF